jgi:hypothetical protein
MSSERTVNTIISSDTSYNGLFYAYEASGGFVIEQGIATTTIFPYSQINRYDMTNSVQVRFDVRTFNEKIGLIKDSENAIIISSTYDENSAGFPDDNVTLSATEFSNAVNENEIISVGKYRTLYSDFQALLNNYFGYPVGFNSLFTVTTQVNINNGVFDASAMVNIMKFSALNASGEYVNTMTGNISITNTNSILRFACQHNPFNNRTSETIEDGFIENDLIYVPTGTTITLVASIVNANTPNNYIIPTTDGLDNIIQSSPGQDYTSGFYSQETTFSANEITRVVRVPLLLVLKNLS